MFFRCLQRGFEKNSAQALASELFGKIEAMKLAIGSGDALDAVDEDDTALVALDGWKELEPGRADDDTLAFGHPKEVSAVEVVVLEVIHIGAVSVLIPWEAELFVNLLDHAGNARLVASLCQAELYLREILGRIARVMRYGHCMRAILTLLVAASLVASPLSAMAGHQGPPPPGRPGFGGPGGPGGRPRGDFDAKILDSLHLNAGQKAKIKKLKDKRRAEFEKVFGKPGSRPPGPPPAGDREKFRAVMEKSRASYRAGLQKILTKSQWAKYEAETAKMRAQFRQRGPGPRN